MPSPFIYRRGGRERERESFKDSRQDTHMVKQRHGAPIEVMEAAQVNLVHRAPSNHRWLEAVVAQHGIDRVPSTDSG